MEEVIEGTWEEIQSRANELAGHRLRVTILDNNTTADEDRNQNALEEAVSALINRTPDEIEATRARLFAEREPPRPLPEGKHFLMSFMASGRATRATKRCIGRSKDSANYASTPVFSRH